MSINGELVVIRNGRSASQVSVYNYPEHLNPFYEEDNHKRLRFWKIIKRDGNEGRRNSFSIGGIKDMWAFKSFRLKKKSSTLGINKTSESPPMVRRDFLNYQRSSHTIGQLNDNNNFKRCDQIRSSLQTVYQTKTTEPNGFGFNRNDKYMSTHLGASSSPKSLIIPTSRRFGGTVSSERLYNSDFERSESMAIISHGSSQTSVRSTNPFENDVDEYYDDKRRNDLTAMGQSRKKRRAPSPPVLIPKAQSVISDKINSREECETNNYLKMVNLTAEIESFVKTSNAEILSTEKKGDMQVEEIPDEIINEKNINRSPPKDFIAVNNLESTNITTKNNMITFGTETKDVKDTQINASDIKSNIIMFHPKMSPDMSFTEVGHVECIHVQMDSARSSKDTNEPSRVTSFKKFSTANTCPKSHNHYEKHLSVNHKQDEYNANKNLNISENNEHFSQDVNTERSGEKTTNVWMSGFKPNIATKPIITSGIPSDFIKHTPETSELIKNVAHNKLESKVNTLLNTSESSKINTKNNEEDISSMSAAKPNIRTKPIINSSVASDSIKHTPETWVLMIKEDDICISPKSIISSEKVDLINPLLIVESSTDKTNQMLKTKYESENMFVNTTTLRNEDEVVANNLLYRVKPTSHMQWRSSTLAPLETSVPLEKRKSVKDIIESINRSQRRLNAAAQKEPQPSHKINNNKKFTEDKERNCNFDLNVKTLDDRQIEIKRMFRKLDVINNNGEYRSMVDTSSTVFCNRNLNSLTTKVNNTDILQNNKNDEVFQKCTINKEVYKCRESSPTTFNLDWNPVPKPKRTINMPFIENK